MSAEVSKAVGNAMSASYGNDGISAAVRALFSMRLHWRGAVGAFVATIPFTVLFNVIGLEWLAERAVWFVGFPVWALIAVSAIMDAYTGANPLYCHSCGKRVKMDYTVCHHCGHEHASGTVAEPIDRYAAPLGHNKTAPAVPVEAPPAEATPPRESVPVDRAITEPVPASPPSPPSAPTPPPPSLTGTRSGIFDLAERRSVQLAVPADVAFEKLCDAMQRKGRLTSTNPLTRTLTGKMRYGVNGVRLRVTVESADVANTAAVAIAADGQDVFGVAARKVSERLLDAIE